MNALVIYDSAYGNTARVAEAISDSLKKFGESKASLVNTVSKADLNRLDLIVIGSPTQGGRPTKPVSNLIDELPNKINKNAKLAVFDTRFEAKEQKKALQLLMKIIGYAAPKMAAALTRKGFTVVSDPQGFIVSDQQGPLRKGELEKAASWAEKIFRDR